MSDLNSMVGELRFWGRIETSEGFADPGDLQTIVTKAAQQHNASYSCSVAKFTIPDKEVPVVGILALALLCQLRAAKFSNAPSMRTGDFQTATRDTPFEKQMKLYTEYMARYNDQCRVLGLSTYFGAQSVKVTEFTAENIDTGVMMPLDVALEPPVVNLAVPSVPVGGVTILAFTTDIFSQFAKRYVFYVSGSEPIYQPWNIGSITKVPCVNDAAEKLLDTGNQRAMSMKVQELVMTPGTIHRFLVVTENKAGLFSYSNEVTVTMP